MRPIGLELASRVRRSGPSPCGASSTGSSSTPTASWSSPTTRPARVPRSGAEQDRLGGVHFYSLLCERLLGRRPARVQLLYLSTPGGLVHRAQRAVGDRHGAPGRGPVGGGRAGLRTRTTSGPTASRLCDWCTFQAYCPAWGGDPAAGGELLRAGRPCARPSGRSADPAAAAHPVAARVRAFDRAVDDCGDRRRPRPRPRSSIRSPAPPTTACCGSPSAASGRRSGEARPGTPSGWPPSWRSSRPSPTGRSRALFRPDPPGLDADRPGPCPSGCAGPSPAPSRRATPPPASPPPSFLSKDDPGRPAYLTSPGWWPSAGSTSGSTTPPTSSAGAALGAGLRPRRPPLRPGPAGRRPGVDRDCGVDAGSGRCRLSRRRPPSIGRLRDPSASPSPGTTAAPSPAMPTRRWWPVSGTGKDWDVRFLRLLARPDPRRRGRDPGLGAAASTRPAAACGPCCGASPSATPSPTSSSTSTSAVFRARHDEGQKIAEEPVLREVAANVGPRPGRGGRRGRLRPAAQGARGRAHRGGRALRRLRGPDHHRGRRGRVRPA